jgi:hypothetical protein
MHQSCLPLHRSCLFVAIYERCVSIGVSGCRSHRWRGLGCRACNTLMRMGMTRPFWTRSWAWPTTQRCLYHRLHLAKLHAAVVKLHSQCYDIAHHVIMKFNTAFLVPDSNSTARQNQLLEPTRQFWCLTAILVRDKSTLRAWQGNVGVNDTKFGARECNVGAQQRKVHVGNITLVDDGATLVPRSICCPKTQF